MKKVNIKNNQDIENLLQYKDVKFYQLYNYISDKNLTIDENFDTKHEYEGLYPHALLKPTQSGLSLIPIAYEAGDNSTDASCENLEYAFEVNEKNLINMIIQYDVDGIPNHDIEKAISYGGYFGPKDTNKSGKYMEGFSNLCGCAADIVEIYTNNGDGWYKSRVNFLKLKNMVKSFEESVNYLDDKKKDLYRGISYKYIANAYIEKPKQVPINDIKSIANESIITKNKGTILVFKDCHKDIIDKDSFIEDIKNLKEALGRRYWRDIDNGTKISIIENGTRKEVKSIDYLMRSENCNYRNAFNTTYFELKNIFKVSDFTHDDKDEDYLTLNVCIKEKTELYAEKIPKKSKIDYSKKILVPKILAIGIKHQGLTVERNGKPIEDNVECGLTSHNNYNGICLEMCVDSRMDESLFVTGNKSRLSSKKLNRMLSKKLDYIMSEAFKVKCKKQDKITYIDADGQEQEVYPTIIKYDPLKEDNSCEKIKKDDKTEEKLIINIPQNIKKEQNYNIKNLSSNYKKTVASGLVFAAKYKSEIERFDSDSNKMRYKRKDEDYLIYDDEIDEQLGIRNKHLQDWWSKQGITNTTLEKRLIESINSNFQKEVFNIYKNQIEPILKENTPALLPEVELFRNSYTNKEKENSEPQRMDFCLIMPSNKKIIIEVDGIHHFAEKENGKWIASDKKYASQCKFDNEWQLRGNEIYRISNRALMDNKSEDNIIFIKEFFIKLFKKHKILN